MMLENNVHQSLFDLFKRVLGGREMVDKCDEDTGFLIMFTLAALV